jgi:biotin carboxyl carrier protein
MDIRKVKKLIELLDESGIAEIEITEGEESVRISRHSPHAPMQMSMAPPPAYAAPAAPAKGAVEEKGHQVEGGKASVAEQAQRHHRLVPEPALPQDEAEQQGAADGKGDTGNRGQHERLRP